MSTGTSANSTFTGAGTSERAFGGPVTVEVGDGAGALVVYLDNNWLDDEIHLHRRRRRRIAVTVRDGRTDGRAAERRRP